jgi:hypothetical protein
MSNDEVEITVLPPGRAQGCDDLRQWGKRRLVGKSGVWDKKDRKKKNKREQRLMARPLPRGSFAK